MPIIYQKHIYRDDLKANPNVLYVFGDNILRRGLGGQAKQMRGEPNAVGVATKWTPTMNKEAFFSDDHIQEQQKIVIKDLIPIVAHLSEGKNVVWPLDGIGSGLSQVPKRSPKMWAWMEALREMMEIDKFSNESDVWFQNNRSDNESN